MTGTGLPDEMTEVIRPLAGEPRWKLPSTRKSRPEGRLSLQLYVRSTVRCCELDSNWLF
jgi:hypothetical protein